MSNAINAAAPINLVKRGIQKRGEEQPSSKAGGAWSIETGRALAPQRSWTSEPFKLEVDKFPAPWMSSSGTVQQINRASHLLGFQRQQSGWASEQFRREVDKIPAPWIDSSGTVQQPNQAHQLFDLQPQSEWTSEEFKRDVEENPAPWMDLPGTTSSHGGQERDGQFAQDQYKTQLPAQLEAQRLHAQGPPQQQNQMQWTSEEFKRHIESHHTLDTKPPGTNTIDMDLAFGEGPRDLLVANSVRQSQAKVIDLRFKREMEECAAHARWFGRLGYAEWEASRRKTSSEADDTTDPKGSESLSKATPAVLDYQGPPLWNPMAAEEAGFSPFQYTPLSQHQEIRLLRLLPGQVSEPLRFELQQVSLDSNPQFISLSYAWGSKAKAPAAIFCDRSYIQIPENLFAALGRLRSTSEVQVVWADAACINQTDEMEKGHQVRLMRRIYKSASKVTIWLGPDHLGLAAGAFEVMRRIHQRDMQAVPPPEAEAWSGISQMFQREWFWRVWCLQEVALASTAEVIWGSETIQWEQLSFASAWIRSSPASALRQQANKGLYNACLMYSLSNASITQTPTSFLQLLTLSRQFLASDKRDKVYGLLGLPTTDADPDQGKFFLEPNYTKTVQQVYQDCAAKIIETSGSLRILSFVQHSDSARLEDSNDESPSAGEPLIKLPPSSNAFVDGLPSWVPRWHQYFAQTLCPPDHVTHQFNASVNLKQSLPSIKGSSLLASGVRFSTVTEVSSTMADGVGWRKYLPVALKSLLGLELLGLTITAGKNWFGTLVEDQKEHLNDFKTYLSNPLTPVHPSATRFKEALNTACTERKMFTTQNGFLGLGPQAMERDDVICVLSGAIVPLVLRPRDGCHMLVGEAYVYGLMFGECVDVGDQRMFEII